MYNSNYATSMVISLFKQQQKSTKACKDHYLTFTVFPSPQRFCFLSFVCSSNGDGSTLTSKVSFQVNLSKDDTLLMDLCDHNFFIIQLNRARYTIYNIAKEILDFLNEKAFLERVVVELIYKFDETSTPMFEKVSRPLK